MTLTCLFSGAALLLALSLPAAPVQSPVDVSAPRVFLADAEHLLAARKRIQSGDKAMALVPALARLELQAKKALIAGPFSVVDDAIPPSGDRHDYMSQAPYFWPDPANTNGLPYIRRDGERNPAIDRFPDHRRLDEMIDAVETLALGWYLQGDEKCASKATQLVRAWFLDPATRMNPNLQYAQAIPGITSGRGIGLIETRGLTRLVDAVGLLAGAKSWKAQDQRAVEDWFDKFLQWMLESNNGRDEAAAKNNHGTYYDLQVVSYALFVGRKKLATDTLQAAQQKRIAQQIEPDGRQLLELNRTKAWSYSIGNLQGLMSLARLGENLAVDLWNYQTPDGRSIRKALDYLTPFAVGGQKWTYAQIGGFSPQALFPLLRRAAAKYPDQQYLALLQQMPQPDPDSRSHLLSAQAAVTHP